MGYYDNETYWKLTLEYSNIHSKKFRGTLALIVHFIDEHNMQSYSSVLFKKLQHVVNYNYPKADMGSVRKSINQFIKLGFIGYELKSYHESTKAFLEAKTKRKRRTLFSKIVYASATFSSSVTTYSEQKEINFLIKTLEEVGTLHKKDIIGLMTVNILEIKKGYLDEQELEKVRENAKEINFRDRKYNQIAYLWSLLRKLDDLKIVDDVLYFKEDAKVVLAESLHKKRGKRDNYLHRLYKNHLKEESREKLGSVKCMLESLRYPSLVASHIKPFIDSNIEEAYDPNNGLLLSRNMDILFDKGYITFNKKGKIFCSKQLKKDVKKHLKSYRLDKIFLDEVRLGYLAYHRESVFRDARD